MHKSFVLFYFIQFNTDDSTSIFLSSCLYHILLIFNFFHGFSVHEIPCT